MVNAVVPHEQLEAVALEWAREVNGKSPTAQRMLKYAFNLLDDGLVGQQLFAGEATRLAYHDRRGGGGPRRVPAEARSGLEPVSLALLSGVREWALTGQERLGRSSGPSLGRGSLRRGALGRAAPGGVDCFRVRSSLPGTTCP